MNTTKSFESRHRRRDSSEAARVRTSRRPVVSSGARPAAAPWLQTLPAASFIWGGSRVSAGPDDHKTERVCAVSGPDWEHMGDSGGSKRSSVCSGDLSLCDHCLLILT